MDRVHIKQTVVVVTLAVVLGFAAGCKNQAAPPTDQQLTSDIQAKIQGEGALNAQNIQISVKDGVATLSGTVTDEASRSLAGNDSGTVNGVKTVVNNLIVQPPQQTAAPAPQPSQAVPPQPSVSAKRRHEDRKHDQQPTPAPQAPQQVVEAAPAPAPQAPPPPQAPPKPVVKQVTLPAGTVLPIRITETLDSKTTQTNDAFHGVLASDVGSQGVIAIPHGAAVTGRIVEAREAAHFSGNSLLSLELTQLQVHGQKVSLLTDTYSKAGAGRGKNTAIKAGAGAALGAIIGGIAGGGKGAAIGSVAGGGAGVGVNAATRGQQTVIPTETVINFQLQSSMTVTVSNSPDQDSGDVQDPQLQHR
ncbi:MAG: transporter [Proteobacteria bacterium]|nr:MAG: transporter [Pseudomonadota bacterium]